MTHKSFERQAKTMEKKLEVIILLSLLILASSHFPSLPFQQIVEHWQPALCNTGNKCVGNPQNQFSIHGVWPTNLSNGHTVGPCSGSTFDPQKITALRERMYEKWPDVVNGDEEDLWSQKWSVHGTCSESDYDEFQYFGMALVIDGRHDITSYIMNSGLKPDGKTLYSFQRFHEAISIFTQYKAGFLCNVDEKNRTQLQSVILCIFNFYFSQFLSDCPDIVSNCPQQFYWIGLGA